MRIVLLLFFAVFLLPVAESCWTPLRQTVCAAVINDTKVSSRLACPLDSAAGLGLPTAWDAFWLFPNGPTTYCQLSSAPRVFTVPPAQQFTVTTVLTLAGYSSGANYRDEASISVETVDGSTHALGRFVPSINTLVGGQTSFSVTGLSSFEQQYPFNGVPLCNGSAAYQKWFIPSSLRSQGIRSITVEDPRAALRIYSLSLDNCTSYSNPGNHLMEATMNTTAVVSPQAVFTRSITATSWPECGLAASRGSHKSFLFEPTTSKCTLLNVTTDLVYGFSANPTVVGMIPTSGAKSFGAAAGMPNRNATAYDAWAVARPDRFGALSGHLFLFSPSSGNTLNVYLQGGSQYAIAASSMTQTTSAFLTSWFGGRILTCGEPVGVQAEMPSKYVTSVRSNSSACQQFSYCPTQQLGTTNGLLTVNVNMFPPAVNCTLNQTGMLILFNNAKVGANLYSFQYSSPVAPVDFATTVSALSTLHGGSTVRNVVTKLYGGNYVTSYTTSTDELSEQKWLRTDENGRTRNYTVRCAAFNASSFSIVHRSDASAGKYDCGAYSSIFAAATACELDMSCRGFTTVQFPNGTEFPVCLTNSAIGSSSENNTLFLKYSANATCSLSTFGAQGVNVYVSNAAGTTTYDVLADGVLVGSCSNLPASATSEMCEKTHLCFGGLLPQGTKTVSVRAPIRSTSRRSCAAAMTIDVEFDSSSIYFDPSPTCLTALSQSPDCTAVSITHPCSGSRHRSGIPLTATGCSGTSTTPVYSDLFPTGTFSGIIVAVDTSGTSAADLAAGAVEVWMELSDGSSVQIGTIIREATGQMLHFSPDQTPVKSFNLCSESIALTNSVANAHYFPLPTALTAKGLRRVYVRGPTVKVISFTLARAGCEAGNPTKESDIMFSTPMTFVKPTGPKLSTTSSTSYAQCGLSCFANSNCHSFSMSGSTCELFASFGEAGAFESSARSGQKALISGGSVFSPSISPGAVGVMLSSLRNQFSDMTLFTSTSGSIRLFVKGGTLFRTLIGNNGFTSNAILVTTSIGTGAGITCGSTNFDGGAVSSASCGALLACASSSMRVSANTHVSISQLQTSASCAPHMWGVLATSGTVNSGVEFHALEMTSKGSGVVSKAGNSEIPVGAFEAALGGADYTFSILDTPQGDASDQLTSSRPLLCKISHRVIYKVRTSVQVDSTARYDCSIVGTLTTPQAMERCTADARCQGITVSATGSVLCLSSTKTTTPLIGILFLEKVRNTSCVFSVQNPGLLSVSVAQLSLHSGTGQNVEVLLNGRRLGLCGHTEPFAAGYVSATSNNCSAYHVCVNQLVVETGTLQIVFPDAGETCGGHYGSVIVQLTPAEAQSRAFHLAAATLPYRRTIASTDTQWSLTVSGATSAAVLVSQDRFACDFSCTVPFALNFTLGSAMSQRCGGLVGFEEGGGASGLCGAYRYCGPTSLSGASRFPVSFASTSGELFFSIQESTLRTTSSCDGRLHAVVLSNGIILGADATNFTTRSLFARWYSGPATTSLAMATEDHTSFVANAHLEMPSAPVFKLYHQTTPVFTNLLTTSDRGFVLYDFPASPEEAKSMHNGTFACIADSTTDDREVRCRMKVFANYVTVTVAQSKFDTSTDTVTVSTNGTTKVCGGDGTFFGFRGLVGRCDAYFTCFEGYIVPGEIVSISFSSSAVRNSRCRPSATALVRAEDRPSVPPLVCNDNTLPFKCSATRECLPLARVCDNVVDCPDRSDEANCAEWNFAAAAFAPSCAAVQVFLGAHSATECTRRAITSEYQPTVFTVNTTGCFLFACVDFSNPQLQSVPSTTETYVFTYDPFTFKYCTNALHCSGHGSVVSATAPCVCNCFDTYIGRSCDAVTSLIRPRQIVVVFNASSEVNSELISIVQNAFITQLPSLSTVSVDAIERFSRGVGVFITVRESTGALKQSSDMLTLLTNKTRSALMEVFTPRGGLHITATQVSSTFRETSCLKASVADGNECNISLSAVNSTRSLRVSVTGVVFTSSSQFVDITVGAVSSSRRRQLSLRCNTSNAITARDYSVVGQCSYLSVCTFPLEEYALKVDNLQVTASSGINPDNTICDSNRISMKLILDGTDYLTDIIDVIPPETTTTSESLYLYLFFALLAVGIIFVIFLVTWFRIRSKYPGTTFLGPIFGGAGFFFIVFSFTMLAYFIDTHADHYTHSLVVEEYRDRDCSESYYSSIPLRSGLIPADDKCYEVPFVGTTESSLFVAAKFGADKAGNGFFRSGRSQSACDKAQWKSITLKTCYDEELVAPWKPQTERQYISFRGMLKSNAVLRVKQISPLNPTPAAESPTVVGNLPANNRFDALFPKNVTFLFQGSLFSYQRPALAPTYLVAPVMADVNASASLSWDTVRFRANIYTARTALNSGGLHVVDEAPRQSPAAFVNQGLLFSKAPTAVFMGVAGSRFDLSTMKKSFSLTIWVKATDETRGFAFMVSDGWLGKDFSSPLADRLLSSLESGELGHQWFSEGWTVNAALYLNGGSGRVSLVTASPGKGVHTINWNVNTIGAQRLFDGGWHFLSVTSRTTTNDRREWTLYVDGESKPGEKGWRQCSDVVFPPVRRIQQGDAVKVYTSKDASVTPDGVVMLGALNGGVFAFAVHAEMLTQEDIVNIGATSMQLYSTVAVGESLALGIVTAVITALMVLYSLYLAFKKEFLVDEEEFEVEAVYDERGRRVHTDQKQTNRGSAFSSSVSFSNFISPLLLLFQTITLFLQNWTWPADYVDFFDVFAIVSLDLSDFVANIPTVTWALLQFGAAIVIFIVMIVVALTDVKRFEAVVQLYKDTLRSRVQKKPKQADDELVDIPRPHYKWVAHASGGTRDLTPEQQEALLKSLGEILTARHRRESNMRVFTKNLVDMGELGTGIVLYERVSSRVYISLRTSKHSLEHDQQADVLELTQTYFELKSDNVSCPEHHKRLLPDDLQTASCVHSSNPYYRSKECPKKCIMYKCPVESCEYAVCEFCYGGGALGGAVSDAMKRLRGVRTAGIASSAGSFLVIFAGLIYIPAVKNALMIISCHDKYRCEFNNCWDSPSIFFMAMVLLSVVVVTCVAVGFILLEVWVLHSRHRLIAEALPMRSRKPKNMLYDFIMPAKTVYRADFNEFLDMDTSMLHAMYTSYEYDFFFASPVLVFYRLLLIAVVVLLTPNSLSQLALATTVSLLLALALIFVNMYKNVWVEVLVRLGAFHTLVQLALMSLHRVDVRADFTSIGYVRQMIAVTFLYVGIVLLLWVIVVLVPYFRMKWEAYKRRRSQSGDRAEDEYDIGFWGEIRYSDPRQKNM